MMGERIDAPSFVARCFSIAQQQNTRQADAEARLAEKKDKERADLLKRAEDVQGEYGVREAFREVATLTGGKLAVRETITHLEGICFIRFSLAKAELQEGKPSDTEVENDAAAFGAIYAGSDGVLAPNSRRYRSGGWARIQGRVLGGNNRVMQEVFVGMYSKLRQHGHCDNG